MGEKKINKKTKNGKKCASRPTYEKILDTIVFLFQRTSLVANFLISDYQGPGADDAAHFVFEIRFRSPLRLYISNEREREREMEVITLII